MDSEEKVRDIPQKQAKPRQSNGAALSDGQVNAGAPSEQGGIENWAPADGLRVTLEEYWEKWYERPHPHIDVSYEWNNGILEAKPSSNYPQTKQYRWFIGLLDCYLEVNPTAKKYYAWRPAPTCPFLMRRCRRRNGRWYSSRTSASSWTTILRLGAR